MHLTKVVSVLLIPMFLASSPAFAQQARVVDSSAMNQALAGKADAEQAQRELVRRVLDRDDAKEMAGRLGLRAEDAGAAVSTLSGADLDAAARYAGAVDEATLAGGSNTIIISTTTLLLILIIVILLVK